MITLFKHYFEKRKLKRKEEAFDIIRSKNVKNHYPASIIYESNRAYSGNYVVIEKEGNRYFCSLAYDYTVEEKLLGYVTDTSKTKELFRFELTKDDTLYQKVVRDYTVQKNISNQNKKNKLLANLTKLDEDMTKINVVIDEMKKKIENKKEQIHLFANENEVDVGKHLAVDEQVKLDKMITKRKELRAKKDQWLKEVKCL